VKLSGIEKEEISKRHQIQFAKRMEKECQKETTFSENKTPHVYIRVTNMKNLSVSLDDLKYMTDAAIEQSVVFHEPNVQNYIDTENEL